MPEYLAQRCIIITIMAALFILVDDRTRVSLTTYFRCGGGGEGKAAARARPSIP